jgi:hypothetical protein
VQIYPTNVKFVNSGDYDQRIRIMFPEKVIKINVFLEDFPVFAYPLEAAFCLREA